MNSLFRMSILLVLLQVVVAGNNTTVGADNSFGHCLEARRSDFLLHMSVTKGTAATIKQRRRPGVFSCCGGGSV